MKVIVALEFGVFSTVSKFSPVTVTFVTVFVCSKTFPLESFSISLIALSLSLVL